MSSHEIKYATESDSALWDGYVRAHAKASLFHRFGWRDVIRGTYGHATYYLMLLAGGATPGRTAAPPGSNGRPGVRVCGVLPIVHLKHALFGKCLVSLPFLDGGGILADTREGEEQLLAEVIALGRKTGVRSIELRQEHLLDSCVDANIVALRQPDAGAPVRAATRSHKVRMLLDLPESSEALLGSFKSKLRSQINRAVRAGFASRIGGPELLGDFYRVFVVNMRDLGSPVHSIELMRRSLAAFPEDSRIVVVYLAEEPAAAALVVGSGNTLRVPWASSLRKHAALGPNMLLYLRLLEHACTSGYRVFDFGRSTPGEGTFRFKEQWGAVPVPLFWHALSLDGSAPAANDKGGTGFELAARYWKKLPLAVTRIVGPRIRMHISL